jgi:hypothetical protein
MARKQTLDAIIQLYKKLGGNTSEVLGTKTNVNFLGKGKSPELMLDMDINPEALGVLPRSKAVEELTSSVGYAVSGKLNDIQASQLLRNMQTMDSVYFPPAAPTNITDLATRTKNLDQEGLMSLRQADDLPPPGSRGGPDDIAAPTFSDANAPFTGAGLEAIKNVKGSNLIVDDIVNKIYLNAGVPANAQPVARANAREFLNRVKDLEDPTNKSGPTLSSIMETDDFKFMTEGGGGGMGDPLLLVQKYFGPKVASSVAKLDSPDDIQKFAENLVKIRDARGNTITNRYFDPEKVDPKDFEFAKGGRVGFRGGGMDASSDDFGGGTTSDNKGADEGGHSRFDVGSGYYGETPTPSGGGGGEKKFNVPVNVRIDPKYTPLGVPVPNYLNVAAAVKGGLLNFRTDLFNSIKDEELDSELSYSGAFGPVNVNAKTDFRGNESLGLGFNKGNFSGNAFTDFDGNRGVGLTYSKTFADGGRVPMFMGGAARIGYQALRKYGIEADDITRLFKSLATDKSLVGKEKTMYFKQLNQVLKNPDDFPDGIREIQIKLGIDPIGFKSGGLAGILEV